MTDWALLPQPESLTDIYLLGTYGIQFWEKYLGILLPGKKFRKIKFDRPQEWMYHKPWNRFRLSAAQIIHSSKKSRFPDFLRGTAEYSINGD
jgi:hypothetical protein